VSRTDRRSKLRLAGRLALTLAAAFALWAFLVDHVVFNWANFSAKRIAVPALALVLGAFATVPVLRGTRGPWGRIALAVLACFSLLELRHVWLRQKYDVERAGGTPLELTHPVTTTDLAVRHFDVRLQGLGVPRLRVLELADLHVTEELPNEYYERVTRVLAERDPDIIVFTGDYLSRLERLPLLERFLAGVPRARYGNYGVLGNHDLWLDGGAQVVEVFSRSNVKLLSATCSVVAISGSRGLRLCGTEGPWGRPLTREAIVNGAPGDGPLFVLSHTPDNVYPLRQLGARVVFAGHTHGGQMRLPIIGPVIIPSQYGSRFDIGHFQVEGTDLFVSAGVGADHPALRIYCPPELVEVDFSAGS
jgi:predicted MPP superfamily phosphohydrolase